MRLWHQKLIPLLPRQQLLGQHRECCALRGKGWGRRHSTVDYVFKYDPSKLVAYHYLIISEMRRRGYQPDAIWEKCDYRGKELGFEPGFCNQALLFLMITNGEKIFQEHDINYLEECLDNLKSKGIEIGIKGE